MEAGFGAEGLALLALLAMTVEMEGSLWMMKLPQSAVCISRGGETNTKERKKENRTHKGLLKVRAKSGEWGSEIAI